MSRAKKRYCLNGHDTQHSGRYTNGQCKECNLEKHHRERLAKLVGEPPPEYVPGLRALRESKGYSRREVAWESGMSVETIKKIEHLKQRATYEQRVLIFQALNVLGGLEMAS